MKQQFWNDRYQQADFAYGEVPNSYLVEKSVSLERGMKIMCPGDGEGRNGLWLSSQGMDIWSVDYSLTGLIKAKRQMNRTDSSIKFVCIDLKNWIWPEKFFDGIVLIFVHFEPSVRKNLHQEMIRSLKPGGYIIMQAFHRDQIQFNSGGPKDVNLLYTVPQLLEDFAGCRFLELAEKEIDLQEGQFHQGRASVINLHIQKP